ncbi:alkaline phosphatase family protein [Niabella sp. CC-SYL272]|uniref:alkaline phosphatase family protein n=1 Tax=Niabella agricola TaxID=2891571 RepID=UPI001F37248F|nr:nucleotide pyrophosphatase/phosphodiesterase family protein [Niabella agricola]MCF3108777.1 alkaline phosphatase family protein [Niabella agricola]
MQKTVVINIVGLSKSVLHLMPFVNNYAAQHHLKVIEPMLPAVTTAVQSTYLTGKWPSETGIVGNGWYDRTDSEVKFWKQSNHLVQSKKIWEAAKEADPSFTSSNMFWWYNMYSSVDYSATPRPNYLADGRKIPDCYTHPASLRDHLQQELGKFPLFQFWGPGAHIKSSQWIADASIRTDRLYNPTLTLVYLPHLDYCLQKFGNDEALIKNDCQEVDLVVRQLIQYYQEQQARIILLSEYGITPVFKPVHINRILRSKGYIAVREERGLELLDAGASKAFAVADHQIAHIYIADKQQIPEIKSLFENTDGIAGVLDKAGQVNGHIHHERSGDLVLIAASNSWFTYYFWEDDKRAPDYARCVDIHKKPGYDPVELFMTSKLRAAYKLLKKKLGMRYVMDVIPMDASLVKGSHGSPFVKDDYKPVLITKNGTATQQVRATDIYDIIWQHLCS